MSKLEMDAVDAALVIMSFFGASIVVGIGSYSLFGVEFGAELFSVAGYSISTAWALLYGSIIGTILTNDNAEFGSLNEQIQNLEQYYAAAAALTLVLPVAFIVFPDLVASFFESGDIWGLSFVGVTTVGQFALGWML
jgi:hypothetical protein